MIPRLAPPFDFTDFLALFPGGTGADFERALAAFCGRAEAVAFPMARAGLWALIECLGWKDREIVMPAYSCAVLPSVVVASGNRPRFVDVDPADFNMRPPAISGAAAVLPTHMYGHPMAMPDVPGAMVIGDCALALGARHGGRPVTALGDASMVSFSIGKHVSTVEGGALLCDDPELARTLRQHRDRTFAAPRRSTVLGHWALFLAAWIALRPALYGPARWIAGHTPLLNRHTHHFDAETAYVPRRARERLAPSLARLGVGQLKRAADLVERRASFSRDIRARAAEVDGLTVPQVAEGASFSHCALLCRDRPGFIAHMARRGVEVGTQVFDYVLPDLPVFRQDGDFAGARKVAAEVVLIPNHPGLGAAGRARVLDALGSWRVS